MARTQLIRNCWGSSLGWVDITKHANYYLVAFELCSWQDVFISKMAQRQNSSRKYESKSYKDESVSNYPMNEEVKFGVDHSMDRQKTEDMRQQIEALFSAAYKEKSQGEDEGNLENQLRTKCNIE